MNENEITIDIRKPEEKPLYFRDVKYDGFFIDNQGRLCQRWGDYNSYNIIADKNGKNCHRHDDITPNQRIDRLVSIKFLL